MTVLQVTVFGALMFWQADTWTRSGRAGLVFARGETPARDAAPVIGPFHVDPGAVILVEPHSPAAEAGLKGGDRVVTVEGVAISQLEDLKQLALGLRPGDEITYEIERDGEQIEISLTLRSVFGSVFLISSSLATLLVGLLFLLISLLVFWSRPDSTSAVVFYVMCTAGAAAFFVWTLGGIYFPDFRGIIPVGVGAGFFSFLLVYSLIATLLFSALLHLALVFPRPRPIGLRWPEVSRWIYSIPILPLLTLAALVLGVMSRKHPATVVGGLGVTGLALATIIVNFCRQRRHEKQTLWVALRSKPFTVQGAVFVLAVVIGAAVALLPKPAVIMTFAFLGAAVFICYVMTIVGYSVLTCVALVRSYRESSVEGKLQVRWPMWGTVTALAIYGAMAVASLAVEALLSRGHPATYAASVVLGVVSTLVFLLIPVSFAFAILKYRLLDIDVVISKTVVYGGMTAFVLVTYLLFAGVSGLVLVSATGVENQAVVVMATLFVAVLFVPVRHRLQNIVDRRFLQRGAREVEADKARLIQESLLPQHLPTARGIDLAAFWEPAREVGGDYYDVLELGEGKLAICIGDVVGKGMPAALLMSNLQAAVKAVASHELAPAVVCQRVRRVVCQNLTGGTFVTFFFAVIDTVERVISYVNMGHNPPFLARSNGEVIELATGGPAIARLFRESALMGGEIAVEHGDRLLLYTDGVTEAADPTGDLFGEAHLRDLLGSVPGDANAVVAAIVSEVRKHAPGEPQDDLTLLAACFL